MFINKCSKWYRRLHAAEKSCLTSLPEDLILCETIVAINVIFLVQYLKKKKEKSSLSLSLSFINIYIYGYLIQNISAEQNIYFLVEI